VPNPAGHPKTLRVPDRADATTDKLAKRPVSVLLPEDLDAVIRGMQQPTAWLRRVLIEAARAEGLIGGE
jgi:hypothetical protein